jgi:transposase-like protein
MPAKKEYTAEFKEQAVRFVLEELEPDESRNMRVTVSLRGCR